MKKFFRFTLLQLLFIMIFSTSIYAASSDDSEKYSNKPYIISSYDVNINVTNDNIYEVTEKINVYFNESRHGIFRTLPLEYTISRQDGTSQKCTATISNIKCNDKFSASIQNQIKIIKIGSISKTITGSKEYTLSYTYNIGNDKCTDFDEFYYNIIGTAWDTYIENVTFTITLPKPFDEEALGFSHGQYGSTSSDDIYYNVDGNTITGEYYGSLNPYEGLTARLTLPDNYFQKQQFKFSFEFYLMTVIPLIFVIISAILWFLHGKDIKPVVVPEFNPPAGLNSLEAGFVYTGNVENSHIISLLIYLADKGYIEIEDIEDDSFFKSNKAFTIKKLKDYDGTNENEAIFMRGLFSSGDTVTSADLRNSFYKTINKIKQNLNTKENKAKIFDPSTLKYSIAVTVMCLISFILILIIPTREYCGISTGLFVSIFPIIGFSVMIGIGFKKGTPVPLRLFLCLWGLGFGGIPLAAFILPFIIEDTEKVIGFFIGLLLIALLIFFKKIMPKRTVEGTQLYGQLLGFKNFLETAEKEKLEALVVENPQYFYHVLPYTYIFGISDTWIDKFESIAVEPPAWYRTNCYSHNHFRDFMHSSMPSAAAAMSSSPGGSSSGGHSGGGHSGGGHGGGGGGSW